MDSKHLSKHIILYIDILGMQNKMSNEHSEHYLNVLSSFYDYMQYWNKNIVKILANKDVYFRVFSDNICIAIPVSKYDKLLSERCYSLLAFSQIIFSKALEEKLLIRGGITVGDLYIDNIFIYGKGLIDSYKLENRNAIYPRIIISEDFIKLLRGKYEEDYELDDDGLYSVNILSHIQNAKIDLNKISKFLYEEKEKYKSDFKIYQKYSWFLNKLSKGLGNE